MDVKDRIAVITGGASGIGRSFAERLHADGARHVVIVDRDAEGAKAVAESIGGTAAGIDVSDEKSIQTLVDETEREQGPIDIFFSNAGYVTLGGLEAPVEDLQRMWDVHVVAHIYAARTMIPRMVERGGGYLLSTASAAGLLSQFGSMHYAVTKHAAVALAEWIAITHGHQGIKVSILCPQAVATNIAQNSPDFGKAGNEGAGVASGDGVLEPEDVAECILEAMREGRFHILPHPEVREYVKRKGADVDRWLGGMQRWQGSMYTPEGHPATWLTGKP